MSKWTQEKAEKTLKGNISTNGKVITFTGDATLSKCSAADFLVKNHEYTLNADLKKGDK